MYIYIYILCIYMCIYIYIQRYHLQKKMPVSGDSRKQLPKSSLCPVTKESPDWLKVATPLPERLFCTKYHRFYWIKD